MARRTLREATERLAGRIHRQQLKDGRDDYRGAEQRASEVAQRMVAEQRDGKPQVRPGPAPALPEGFREKGPRGER